MTLRGSRFPWLLSSLLAIGAAFALGWPPEDGSAGASVQSHSASLTAIMLWQVPADAATSIESLFGNPLTIATVPPGSRIVRLDPASRKVDNLTGRFTAVSSPDLSYDAKRILFVGERSADGQRGIWEISLDDGKERRVAPCPAECDRAIYLSSLYTMDADGPRDQIAFRAMSEASQRPATYRCGLDGSDSQQITFTPSGAAQPRLLSNGRLLIQIAAPTDALPKRPQASDSQKPAATELITTNVDGTDVFACAGQQECVIRRDVVETADGGLVFVEEAGPGAEATAALATTSRVFDFRARRVVATSALDFRHPVTLPDGDLLVASRRDGGKTNYELRRISLVKGASTLVYDDPAFHDLPAAVISPRPKPPGHSSVVRPQAQRGQLFCLDSRLTDDREESLSVIRRIRFHRAQSDGSTVERVLLGEAAVEPDGSFFVELPARTPIALEGLDETGRAIRGMQSWFWVMPQERRGCIGCHEDPSMTPPNRHARALRKPPQRIGVDEPARQNAE